ncbi:MAG: ParB/RepB/Spo0J family partition protein [PVC group bacterium]
MADQETATAVYEKGRLYALPIGDIQPDPNQPRKYFDEEGLAELTHSIQDKGVLQPILVRLGDGGGDGGEAPPPPPVILVAGERRLRAAHAAGLATIPALFIDDDKPEEISLIENSLRQNLTAVEEAEAAGRLIDVLKYTREQLGRILGKKSSTIGDILSLNRLPAEIRDECRTNPACPRRVLVEIARKKQERAMVTLYKKYKEKGLTSDEVREEVRTERQPPGPTEQAAAILTGIAALHTRLEKSDWQAFSTDDRSQIQDAFSALTDAFNGFVAGASSRIA